MALRNQSRRAALVPAEKGLRVMSEVEDAVKEVIESDSRMNGWIGLLVALSAMTPANEPAAIDGTLLATMLAAGKLPATATATTSCGNWMPPWVLAGRPKKLTAPAGTAPVGGKGPTRSRRATRALASTAAGTGPQRQGQCQ